MQFEAFKKIPRLNRKCVVTEKIDGTNAQILIRRPELGEADYAQYRTASVVDDNGVIYDIFAGSRNRYITPGNDNFGFAKFVLDNAAELAELGEGRHFGEWWGQGIQRGYGLSTKRFSLFNVGRWNSFNVPECCFVVPTLGEYFINEIPAVIDQLRAVGSIAAPGFMSPEGVVAYHTASGELFKVLLENDDQPKGSALSHE